MLWSPLLAQQWNAEPKGYVVEYRATRPRRLGGAQHSKTMSVEATTAAAENKKDEGDEKWVNSLLTNCQLKNVQQKTK